MEENIKLSIVERQLLINQLKIMQLLDSSNDDYQNQITALEQGYEIHYPEVFSISEDTMSVEECRLVLDILEMFRGIIYSYLALERLHQLKEMKKEDVRFVGFDGNNETKYMFYARYFINDLDRYSEIQEISYPDYNSHAELLPTYRVMLNRWRDFQEKLPNPYLMTEEQIKVVLGDYNARIY